jgi:crossover junction endodeoxyribonuclease RuvC
MGYVLLNTFKKPGKWLVRSGTLHASKEYKGFDKHIDFANQFMELLEATKPDFVVFEGYAYGGFQIVPAATTGTLFRYACYGVTPFCEVAPTSLKSFVCGAGSGKKNKDKIMLEVYKRWGFEGTDDECDAYGLAMFGIAATSQVDMPKASLQSVQTWKGKHVDTLKELLNATQ